MSWLNYRRKELIEAVKREIAKDAFKACIEEEQRKRDSHSTHYEKIEDASSEIEKHQKGEEAYYGRG
jgi:hypothetical protein